MDLLDTAGGRLAYDERGDGPALVLLPSGAHERGDYDALRERLGGAYRTIAIDWPAHGESPAPGGPASAMTFAAAARDAVAALAPEGAIVIGNSVGGYAAARLAIDRPELVRALVLVDSGGFDEPSLRARLFCAAMARPALLRRIYPTFSRRYMSDNRPPAARSRELAIATTRRPAGAAVVSGLWRSFPHPDHDLRAHAGSISAPTLVIWGRHDPVIPVASGERAAALISGAELKLLDTGHLPFLSDPDRFAAALVPFLERALAVA